MKECGGISGGNLLADHVHPDPTEERQYLRTAGPNERRDSGCTRVYMPRVNIATLYLRV